MEAHGGDIYRQKVELDFSVNENPCGMPVGVKEALHRAVEKCVHYPDPKADKLRGKLAEKLQVSRENILVGNGASELFPAIVRAIVPKKTIIPVPSFGGYEYAASHLYYQGSDRWQGRDGCQNIVYYMLTENNGFALTEEIFSGLNQMAEERDIAVSEGWGKTLGHSKTKAYDSADEFCNRCRKLLFLAQPNNPVGNLMDVNLLEQVLSYCREKEIYVVLDECFLELCQGGEAISFVRQVKEYPNLLVVRAFTKTYAMPGVRLGYVVCSDEELLARVQVQLAEWNVSILAQEAGLAALEESKYLEESVKQISTWRGELEVRLNQLGFTVYPGKGNFVFFRWEQEPEQSYLYKNLLHKKILIRDCSNYRGLESGYYRVAVRTEEENTRLVNAIKVICEERKGC